MSEFLMELYSEEIPPSAQLLGESELKGSIEKLLIDKKINYSELQTFSTPRRIAIAISNLEKQSSEKIKEIRGPSTQANESALEGFLRSQGIKNEKYLIKRKIKDKEYYFFKKKVVEKNIIDILAEEIPIVLSSIRWKKSMRWSSIEEKWSRPIRNILCVFNRKVIKFSFAGLNSNSYTFPNYHYSSKKIKCEDFKFYRKVLEDHYVILDSNDRQQKINQNLEKFCKQKKIKLNKNEELIRRV
jgi:glycyl-tRNA synthetase beta chain